MKKKFIKVISCVAFGSANRQRKSNEDKNKKHFFIGKVKLVKNKISQNSTKKLLKSTFFAWSGAHFP